MTFLVNKQAVYFLFLLKKIKKPLVISAPLMNEWTTICSKN